ncbi:hypothetical protein BGW37DRAFT_189720 [Umbelopsis sp. PMI_123]|nr:hypothetical protein BGW37DRAFT_189720 [Umbelopsis sp. PMI_123]
MDSLSDMSATSNGQLRSMIDQETMDLYDARARLRIMTDNQSLLLEMYKENVNLLQQANKELCHLRTEHNVVLANLNMSEQEKRNMLDMKERAENEKEAIRKESRRALTQAEDARNRLQIEYHQLQQLHQTNMEKTAKSRKEMENEMLILMQELETERKKVTQLDKEKKKREQDFERLQQSFFALERMANEIASNTAINHQPSSR